MNIFSLSSLLISCTSVGLSIFLLRRGAIKKVSRILGIFCLLVATWGIGTYILSTIDSKELAFFWWQITHIGVIFTPVLYFHFVSTFLNLNRKHLLLGTYFLGLIFLMLNFFARSLFLGDLRFVFNQFYWIDWIKTKSPAYLFFYISFYWILLAYPFFLLLREYKFANGFKRNQLKYFILGSMVGWLGPHSEFLLIFRIDVYPYSNFLIAIYPAIWAYAIIKYRLMDIHLAVTRTGVFVAVYSLVLGTPFVVAYSFRPFLLGFFGDKWWLVPMGLLTVLATVGPFIFIYINKKAEDRLLQEQRRYQHTLRQASSGMIRIRELRKLLDLIVYVVTKTVKIEFSAMFLMNAQNNHYSMVAKRGALNLAPDFSLDSRSPLIQELYSKREPIVYEEVQLQSQDSPHDSRLMHLEKHLREINASVIVPSYVGNKLLGFLVLGKKLSGKIYSQDDLNVFSVLANQAALAIENIRYFEKLEDVQKQLSQSEKLAAVGRFAASVVHEVKNPLTSIKAFTEYLPQKYQDKEFIEKYSRIVSGEIDKLNNLTHQLLDFSKPISLKLEKTDIHKLLDETLDLLSNDFMKHKISVNKDYAECSNLSGDSSASRRDTTKNGFIRDSDDKVITVIDAQRMRQVFLNLFLNSIDAMPSGGTLTLSTVIRDNSSFDKLRTNPEHSRMGSRKEKLVIISVQDTGSGIPEKDLPHIFEPFYSTKEKGTGLGLAITYSIIKEHKGEIKVESQIGKGTKFEIVLPFSQ